MAGHAHPRATELDALLDRLRSNGERITTARRAVLQELLDAPDQHLAIEELATRVQARNPEIHLSTVYRTLDFLTEAGILVNVHLGPDRSSYHLATESHHHAMCDGCGRTIELPAEVLDGVVRHLDTEFGFEAHPHHVVIEGTCAACRTRS